MARNSIRTERLHVREGCERERRRWAAGSYVTAAQPELWYRSPRLIVANAGVEAGGQNMPHRATARPRGRCTAPGGEPCAEHLVTGRPARGVEAAEKTVLQCPSRTASYRPAILATPTRRATRQHIRIAWAPCSPACMGLMQSVSTAVLPCRCWAACPSVVGRDDGMG